VFRPASNSRIFLNLPTPPRAQELLGEKAQWYHPSKRPILERLKADIGMELCDQLSSQSFEANWIYDAIYSSIHVDVCDYLNKLLTWTFAKFFSKTLFFLHCAV
jgi:hypothetical protein